MTITPGVCSLRRPRAAAAEGGWLGAANDIKKAPTFRVIVYCSFNVLDDGAPATVSVACVSSAAPSLANDAKRSEFFTSTRKSPGARSAGRAKLAE